MKTDINRLEKSKQEELDVILKIILDIWKKHIKPEIVIVFGDYLKRNFRENNLVREWNHIVEYRGIVDILIVTRKPNHEKNMRLSREIISVIKNKNNILNSVNIMIEDIFNFDQAIREKRYFYIDIINEWILLYDSKKYSIKNIKNINKIEVKKVQKEDFHNWFNIAGEFLKDYKNAYERSSYKIAIFYLHQSTEMFITCYLIVKTWYKPKTHDLEVLYSKLKNYTNKFNTIFDLNTENEIFELIRWAYINSRYKKAYIVEKKDLDLLEEKIIKLSKIVKVLCKIEFKK